MRRPLIVLASVVALGALIASRPFWFASLDEHMKRSRDARHSHVLDLSRPNSSSWAVTHESWPYLVDVAEIYLVFERTPQMTGRDYWKRDFPLRIRVSAEAQIPGVLQTDRLILTYFNRTNEPTRDRPNVWAGWSDDRAEYLLGYTVMFPYETLHFRIDVTSPDPDLALARPRIKLVPNYDTAVAGHIAAFWVLRDAILGAGCIAVLFLAIASWRAK